MNPADAVDRVQDFFCNHRALEIVSWDYATGRMTYRCQNPKCGKQADSLRAFNEKAYP